ncbi:MAG TPA: ABC transporter ATP-binding protein [Thermoplasmata archaeon]|nr:ABC transporter ATP-binding protein [Thermoplasmata archaeon]
MMAAARAIDVADLSVSFDGRRALHAVDLEVARGEFVALTGPNGSGKTTLLRAILGFQVPDAGRVRLFGAPVDALPIRERARRVAWVPQSESVRDDVPLAQYVLYGRYAYHHFLDRDTAADRALAQRALSDVGLADRADDGLLSISGGERQRAILARALAQGAPLLLLDEPTTHLDIAHQLDLLGRVRSLARREGVTVVAALHDLNLAARYADRIVVLSRGRRVADGPPGTVLSEELLARVWGVDADLRVDERTGLPYLLPRRLVSEGPAAPGALGRGPVHVVGGGGAGAPILRALIDEGFRVSAGALHLLDSDAETAEALGIVAAVEAPFAPLSDATRARHRALLEEARAIVVAPFPVGPSNLANLEDLRPFVPRIPTILLEPPPDRPIDFIGGAATAARSALVAAGARTVRDVPEALRAVADALAANAPRSTAGPADRQEL